jgi:bacterial/archaeal transporter family-2 protein
MMHTAVNLSHHVERYCMTYFYVFLAFVAGVFLPVQVGVNNSLRTGIGSPILAAFISFAVGTICLLTYAMVMRSPWPSMQVISRLPPWAWWGGALGAYYVATSIFVAPRLGAANLISITVAAQLFMSLALDHYGMIGFAQHGINGWRLFGALLLIAGCVLIVRN